jgi:hypothetical protein
VKTPSGLFQILVSAIYTRKTLKQEATSTDETHPNTTNLQPPVTQDTGNENTTFKPEFIRYAQFLMGSPAGKRIKSMIKKSRDDCC